MFYEVPDGRTEVEKQYDLMKQMKEETQLDNRLPKSDEQLAQRLAKLRGEPEKDDNNIKGINTICYIYNLTFYFQKLVIYQVVTLLKTLLILLV